MWASASRAQAPRGSSLRTQIPAWVIVVSALALITTPVVVWATRPRFDVGSMRAVMADPGPASTLAGAVLGREPVISTPPGVAASNIVVRSARLGEYEPPPHGPRPVGLTIEAIGVRADVVPVGVEDGLRAVEVPADVEIVGWYRFGPSPGASGSAVLIGHVDSRTQGSGVFFRLQELGPGDTVSVAFANGSRSSFRVVARRSYPKGQLPGEVFQRSGRPVLTLVTCGGPFDWATRSYSENVVVFAVPLD